MAISKEELGRRMRVARERAGFKQEAAAAEIGLSRGALAQFEAGAKAPNSLHLARLGEIYRQGISELLAPEFDEGKPDALTVLFRADSQLANDHERATTIAECARLCREYTNLETLLGIDQERVYPLEYGTPPIRTRWDAIRQGERLAESERARLQLGDDAIGDVAEILEPQGVRFIEMALPENISGLFLLDGTFGPTIFVNELHHQRRQAFSCAHEYCHVLVDRGASAMVSRTENRDALPEVRANAFAAAFLMPESGVRAFVRRLGKGESSRSQLQAYDELGAIGAQRRMDAGSQDLQVYDVAHLAHHFGVSYEMALYRLLNLKFLTAEERAALAAQGDAAKETMRLLGDDIPRRSERRPFRHQIVFHAIEAFRRQMISRRKLEELCGLARLSPVALQTMLGPIDRDGEGSQGGRAAYIPKA